MIKVNNLSKEFHEQGTSNELLAVDHVDFTIQNGSFCALVGESGSGKSTLAQLMCGLLVPSSGEVLFEGKNISLCRGKQKQVLRSKIQLILQDGKLSLIHISMLILAKIVFFAVFSGAVFTSFTSIMFTGQDNFGAQNTLNQLDELTASMDQAKLPHGSEENFQNFDIEFQMCIRDRG